MLTLDNFWFRNYFNMADKLQNFRYGPLERYRTLASFDWKQMKLLMQSEEILTFEQRFHEELRKHPLLYNYDLQTPPIDKLRQKSAEKLVILEHIVKQVTKNKDFAPLEFLCFLENIFALDANLGIMYLTSFNLFPDIIAAMGTEKHKKLIQKARNGDIYGCLCYLEIAYGRDEQSMNTTATYDVERQGFILNTPDFKSAKCYVTSGKSANFGIVFAQLILPNGTNKGIHAFVVKLHDRSLKPYPGVLIGSMGEKIGLNGIDHTFIRFNMYPIPKDSLLNRMGVVTEIGDYTELQNIINACAIKYEIVSLPRLRTAIIANTYLAKALTIAVRYAGVRKQFSPGPNEEEVCIIEYQTHQYRLLPYLAFTYATKIFFRYISSKLNQKKTVRDFEELHALYSGAKAIVSWIARDGIQECREACGGHGYLKATGIGELRSSNDYNCTVEGNNFETLQEVSDWLVSLWPFVLNGERLPNTMINSVEFLNNSQKILTQKFVGDCSDGILQPECILNTFKWLVCYMLKSTYEKRVLRNDSEFSGKTENQIFYAKILATVYTQHFILEIMFKNISETSNYALKNVLIKLFQILGCWFLEQYMSKLYIGGYAVGSTPVFILHNSVLKLCKELKNDAIGLVDAIACPDFMMNSILGYSDGEVYKHLQAAIFQHPLAFSRPPWWTDITEKLRLNSKL